RPQPRSWTSLAVGTACFAVLSLLLIGWRSWSPTSAVDRPTNSSTATSTDWPFDPQRPLPDHLRGERGVGVPLPLLDDRQCAFWTHPILGKGGIRGGSDDPADARSRFDSFKERSFTLLDYD